jgi:hypothetical protein
VSILFHYRTIAYLPPTGDSCVGEFDITSSDAGLIYAAKSGNSLNSDSQSAPLLQHDNTYGSSTIDTTQARNAIDTNPFQSTNSSSSTVSNPIASQTSTTTTPPPQDASPGTALSAGAIAGIVLAMLLVIAAVITIVTLY